MAGGCFKPVPEHRGRGKGNKDWREPMVNGSAPDCLFPPKNTYISPLYSLDFSLRIPSVLSPFFQNNPEKHTLFVYPPLSIAAPLHEAVALPRVACRCPQRLKLSKAG